MGRYPSLGSSPIAARTGDQCRGVNWGGRPSTGRRCPAGTSDERGRTEALARPDQGAAVGGESGPGIPTLRHPWHRSVPTRADKQRAYPLSRLNRLLHEQQIPCHCPGLRGATAHRTRAIGRIIRPRPRLTPDRSRPYTPDVDMLASAQPKPHMPPASLP